MWLWGKEIMILLLGVMRKFVYNLYNQLYNFVCRKYKIFFNTKANQKWEFMFHEISAASVSLKN